MKFAGYEIIDEIYNRGRSMVLLARRIRDKRLVAIKALKKTAQGATDFESLRGEYALLKKCESPYVIAALDFLDHEEGAGLVMEHFEGATLQPYTKQERLLSIDKFLDVAIWLARAVQSIHGQHIIHKDITPGNILFDRKKKTLKICDFGIATELDRESQEVNMTGVLSGTLPYISPEQTGRMNCDLDYRTDFYSMGATLFELLTGRVLFPATDNIGYVHGHIATPPPRADEINGRVPKVVADIIHKLVSKAVEDRYQSSQGILRDFIECRDRQKTKGKIDSFDIAARDISERFEIPRSLYGREKEQKILMQTFEKAARGETSVLLISGHSGVGKTALINEIHKPIVAKNGRFVKGKFDKFSRDIPYSALSQAFTSLIRQLISSNTNLSPWRSKIKTAVGANGQLIIDLVPQLEFIIGAQPPLPELGPLETKIRNRNTLRDFISVFASKDHPLVIFLDDLQWSDDATLNLLVDLAQSARKQNLLLIGTYRDNEVSQGHPLTLSMEKIERTQPIDKIFLLPLTRETVGQYLSDTLHRTIREIADLTDSVFRKTEGNPFFMAVYLKSLHVERNIWFDHNTQSWEFNSDKIEESSASGDVAELVVSRIKNLPLKAQNALKLASCLGTQFDSDLLCRAIGQTKHELKDTLDHLLKDELIIPLDDSYRYLMVPAQDDKSHHVGLNTSYRFKHDRILRASYSLLDDETKKKTHHKIAKILLEQRNDDFDVEVAGHYSKCLETIVDDKEKDTVALISYNVSKKSKRAGAYNAAYNFIHDSIKMLCDDPLVKRHDFSFPILFQACDIAYLCGKFQEAAALAEQILEHATSEIERVEIYHLQSIQYQIAGKLEKSIDMGLLALYHLENKKTNKHVSPLRIVWELLVSKWNLKNRDIQDLAKLPFIEDKQKRLKIKILMDLMGSAYLTGNKNLSALMIFKAVNICILYGNCPEAPYVYMSYSVALTNVVGDMKTGKEFADLSQKLMKQTSDLVWLAKSLLLNCVFLRIWHYSKHDMADHFVNTIEPSRQAGDLMSLGGSTINLVLHNVAEKLTVEDKYIDILHDTNSPNFIESLYMHLAQRDNYKGHTDNEDTLDSDRFSEQKYIEVMKQTGYYGGLCTFFVEKARIFYQNEKYDDAYEQMKKAGRIIDSLLGNFNEVHYRTNRILILSALLSKMNWLERVSSKIAIHFEYKKLKKWADHRPENFLYLKLIVDSVLTQKPLLEMSDLFDRAIDEAERVSPHYAAMASKIAADFYIKNQCDYFAMPYIEQALKHYETWGADRMVSRMKEKYSLPEYPGQS